MVQGGREPTNIEGIEHKHRQTMKRMGDRLIFQQLSFQSQTRGGQGPIP